MFHLPVKFSVRLRGVGLYQSLLSSVYSKPWPLWYASISINMDLPSLVFQWFPTLTLKILSTNRRSSRLKNNSLLFLYFGYLMISPMGSETLKVFNTYWYPLYVSVATNSILNLGQSSIFPVVVRNYLIGFNLGSCLYYGGPVLFWGEGLFYVCWQI